MKQTYKEPLLKEVIDRTLKDKTPEQRQEILQEYAWAEHPDNPKFDGEDSHAADILFNFYNSYPHIVAPYLSKADWLSFREYETRKISEEANDAE